MFPGIGPRQIQYAKHHTNGRVYEEAAGHGLPNGPATIDPNISGNSRGPAESNTSCNGPDRDDVQPFVMTLLLGHGCIEPLATLARGREAPWLLCQNGRWISCRLG